MNHRSGWLACLGLSLAFALPPARGADAPAAAPVRALLVAGGCCHDYSRQKSIMADGVSARANVVWTVVQQGGTATNSKIPLYENADWARDFDVVVHDECFSDAADPAWTARILAPHKAGLPAVVLHCAMHSYRDKTDEWFKFLGVTSHGHGANYPFEVVNLAKSDPIMEGFGDRWMTPKGELYLISKLWDTATPLGHARSRDTEKDEVCVWTNLYGDRKTRVFGTTLGHHNEEVSHPVFLNLLTRGLLWSAGKLDADHLRPAAKAASAATAPEDLARGKVTSASSTQDASKAPGFAVDGDPDSRWCADGDKPDQWIRVDLGRPETVAGCRVVWEFDGNYRYKVEGSADGKSWAMLSDQTKTSDRDADRTHRFRADRIRHVRVSITGLDDGQWASLYTLEVHGTKQVKAGSPAAAAATGAADRIVAGVKAPAGWTVKTFAAPPEVRYPTCLAATPAGEVYVGVDENGSLDAKAGRGRVVRCVDTDGDGTADRFTTFAEMDSPRGIVVDGSTVYVLHPPTLSAFHDDNGDGVADRSAVLVNGIGFDLKFRGADHTTNGIRQGIDGWIYVAVGDYGFIRAAGTDGQALSLLGGGVVRVRSDGSGLELVSRGQRNIYDVAIDPRMDLFTRDNTNDGGGWDVRLSHVIPTGNYGYPSLFTRFGDEIVPPLADYGGGSPCGSLYVQEAGLPGGLDDALLTCEWGRGGVFRHPLTPRGASFQAGQEPFLTMPRPTDIDVDGQGRFYVSSWRDGGFNYSKPDIGYVVRVAADGANPPAFPDLKQATPAQLVGHVGSPRGAVLRQAAQRELLRRGVDPASAKALEALAAKPGPIAGRVAAVFTLAQGLGAGAHPALARLAKGETREFALKALADRREDAARVPIEPFLAGLEDKDPRVRLQAVIGLGRIGKPEAAGRLVGMTTDPDPMVRHAAIKAGVAVGAVDAAVAALGRPTVPADLAYGASHILQAIYDPRAVAGLTRVLSTSSDETVRLAAFRALCRLHAAEAPYTGQWWSTRPDTTGPLYKPVPWAGTAAADQALQAAVAEAGDRPIATRYVAELLRHGIDFPTTTARAFQLAAADGTIRDAVLELMGNQPKLAAPALDFLQGIVAGDPDVSLRVKALRTLVRRKGEPDAQAAARTALATVAAQDDPAPGLVAAWREAVGGGITGPRVLQQQIQAAAGGDPGARIFAYARLLQTANDGKAPADHRDQARAALDKGWSNAEALPALLRAAGLLRATAEADRVRPLIADARPAVRDAARFAARALHIDAGAGSPEPVDPSRTLAKLPWEKALADVAADPGDAVLGARLFQTQNCVNCHTVRKGDPAIGPYLGDITTRYNRGELTESILRPGARIAQGFETQKIATTNGQVIEGFISRETGDGLELRNGSGNLIYVAKADIEDRGKSEQSIMPNGLFDALTPHDLASLIAYLDSLKGR